MCGFHRPDALLQPINQRQIISRTAKQGLAEMHVRLHESRQHCAPFSVYHFIGTINRTANALYEIAANEQVALHDRIVRSKREQRAVFYQSSLFHLARKRIKEKGKR
jgi:hypothetical protein